MTEPTRVLAEGRIRYWGTDPGKPPHIVRIREAAVFVIDWQSRGGMSWCTVVAREPMYLPHRPIPLPVGAICALPAWDEDEGDLLTLDLEKLKEAT